MAYEVKFTPAAHREFRKLPKKVQAVLTPRIEALAEDPHPQGAKKLKTPTTLWRLREGDYRVVYQIRESVLYVLIARAGHRKDVYRELASLAKSLPG